jgi:hypothetical protein
MIPLLQRNIPSLRSTTFPPVVASQSRDRSSHLSPRRLLPKRLQAHPGGTRLLGTRSSRLLLPRHRVNLVVLLLHQLHANHPPWIQSRQPRTFDPSLPQATQLCALLACGICTSQWHQILLTTAPYPAAAGNIGMLRRRRQEPAKRR